MAATATSLAPNLPARWRLTADEFDRMSEVGIFSEGDRVELLDGEMFEMAPSGEWHDSQVDRMNYAFSRGGGERVIARVQGPVRISATSQPEPGLSVSRFVEGFYASGRPGPASILLVIEVSDSPVSYDRNQKLPLYARAGLPEVWLVIREPACIEVYTEPRGGVYRVRRIYEPGEVVSPGELPGVQVTVQGPG